MTLENTRRIALTISETARAVGVSRPTIYRWMERPDFPVARVGGVVRIPARAFERWLEAQAGVPTEGGEAG